MKRELKLILAFGLGLNAIAGYGLYILNRGANKKDAHDASISEDTKRAADVLEAQAELKKVEFMANMDCTLERERRSKTAPCGKDDMTAIGYGIDGKTICAVPGTRVTTSLVCTEKEK